MYSIKFFLKRIYADLWLVNFLLLATKRVILRQVDEEQMSYLITKTAQLP